MNGTSLFKRTAVPTACVLYCLLGGLGGGSGTFAGEAPSVADDVAMVRPFIDETTALVLKVDPTRLSLPDLSDTLKAAAPGSDEAYQAWMQGAAKGIEAFRATTGGQAVYATVGIPRSGAECPIFIFLRETPGVGRQQLTDLLRAFNPMESCARDGLVVAMPMRNVDVAAAIDAIVPSPREELADAFGAVGNYPVQVLLLPPDHVRRTVIELMPQLPRQLGGGPSNVLTEGLVWAALGMDPAQLRAELIVKSNSERAAKSLAEHLPTMLRSIYDGLPDLQATMPRKTLEALLPLIKPKVDGDRFTLRLAGLESTGESIRLVATAAAALQERIHRQKNADKFKQIAVAMHNYYDACRAFPPRDEVRDQNGRSKLSWRVYILPFIDEGRLYKEFHLDEPWDSPHNKKLIEKMPKVYRSSLFGITPGHTTFLAPVGEDTVFGGEKATRIHNITDGTSNTVVLVEVKPGLAVPWTAPEDYAFDPKAPGQGLQVGADGWCLTAFADGSVRKLRGNLEPKLLLEVFQKSDGHVVVDGKAIQYLR